MTRTVGLLREGETEGTLEERGGLGGIRKRLGLRGEGREGPAAGWRRMGRREAEAVGIVVGKMKFIAMAIVSAFMGFGFLKKIKILR